MVKQYLVKDFHKLKADWDFAATTPYFRDYIAQGFNEEEAFRKSGEHSTKWIREFLNQHNVDWKDKIVTDLGAGAGRITEFIAKDAKHVNAVDISSKMLKRLYERLKDTPEMKKISTHCIIRDFSILTDLETDIIISYLVFQHTPEDMVERLIEDGRRILRNGGYYFIQIPTAKKHTCAPCNNANAVDMVWWTKQEVEEMAIKYNYKLIYSPKEEGGQFFLFQK